MTQKAIAEEVGKAQQTVSDYLQASTGNKDYSVIIDSGSLAPPELQGNARQYTIARLERDGHVDLAGQVAEGQISARQARLQVGYEAPSVTVTWKVDADPEAIAIKYGNSHDSYLPRVSALILTLNGLNHFRQPQGII